MIRWSIALWLLLIAGAGGALYHLKYKVEALEDVLADVEADIQANQDAVAMLYAEWSYLNDPARIETYADHYLDTRPATVNEIVAFGDLPMAPGADMNQSRSAPDGELPPLPSLTPRRSPPPSSSSPLIGDASGPAMVAVNDASDAPETAPELELIPAGRATSEPAAGTPDAIGSLIANVLDSHSASHPQNDTTTDIIPAGAETPISASFEPGTAQ